MMWVEQEPQGCGSAGLVAGGFQQRKGLGVASLRLLASPLQTAWHGSG